MRELPGVTIAAAGTEFQMFNTAFFNGPVLDQQDLEQRLASAAATFRSRRMDWSLWVCEEFVPPPLRVRFTRTCERFKLYPGPEMPAMLADGVTPCSPAQAQIEIRPVDSPAPLREFCRIGAECFRVPPKWFQQIYDSHARLAGPMRGWVGYLEGTAVTTVATVSSPDSIGIYNLATSQAFRQRGFGETMSRHAIAQTLAIAGSKPVVLQSTKQGLRLYERLGFQNAGRILVFPSR